MWKVELVVKELTE
ncbi:hypothetical protein JCM5805K_1213 [Lactococcus lactis subsp. lactis]|nr:hypothetical protein JCM5805K_1213 [Lactococcus lactis subsp. lactis]